MPGPQLDQGVALRGDVARFASHFGRGKQRLRGYIAPLYGSDLFGELGCHFDRPIPLPTVMKRPRQAKSSIGVEPRLALDAPEVIRRGVPLAHLLVRRGRVEQAAVAEREVFGPQRGHLQRRSLVILRPQRAERAQVSNRKRGSFVEQQRAGQGEISAVKFYLGFSRAAAAEV